MGIIKDYINERKRCNEIIELINIEDWTALNKFKLFGDDNFGLKNKNFIKKMNRKLEEKVINNPSLLSNINLVDIKSDHLNKFVLSTNPDAIEILINQKSDFSSKLIPIALDYGYSPSSDYIMANIDSFSSEEIMFKLFDKGFIPPNDFIKKHPIIFSKENVLSKVLDFGYVPSIEFLSKTPHIYNYDLTERLINTIQLTPKDLNSSFFYGNGTAQRAVIKKHPELLLDKESYGKTFEQFWIEAIKEGYIPDEALHDNFITGSPIIFSRIIKKYPELIHHCTCSAEKMDTLALAMGYIPSIKDAITYEYVRRSPQLMETLIKKRPEAIKYVFEMSPDLFKDLASLSINCGYIPTINDLKFNPRLADSYEIMRELVQDHPELINSIRPYTDNKEELLKLAIENGFNGKIDLKYSGENSHIDNKLIYTETAIKYRIEHGERIDFTKDYIENNYSLDFYNYIVNKGYDIEHILYLFDGFMDIMRVIISENPNLINQIQVKFYDRSEIDELSFLAIEKGYIPKPEDIVFGYGNEITKILVKMYPEYIERVNFFQEWDSKVKKMSDETWQEICNIAFSSPNQYIPNIDSLSPEFYYSYDYMKYFITQRPELIEMCMVESKEQYDQLCKLALFLNYHIPDDFDFNNSKMYSNYDLIADYFERNPEKFYYLSSNIEITDPEQMFNLLKRLSNVGIDFKKKFNEKDLLPIFLIIDEDKWATFINEDMIERLKKAKELYKNNVNVKKTANPHFLSENISKNFTREQVEVISCYPILQEKIVSLSANEQKINIIYELLEKNKNNLEWIPILEKTLNNINSPEFTNLLFAIKDEELSQKDKESLMNLLCTDNHLDITTLDELKNIESIKEKYIKRMIEINTVGSLKAAYLEKAFGIDISTAIDLVKIYGKSLELRSIDSLDDQSKTELVLLENIKNIISTNNTDILRYYIDNVNPDFIVSPDVMAVYEEKLKQLFTNEFNKSFTKPNEEDRIITNKKGEENLDIFLAAGHDGKKKCRMMITSLGAYTNTSEPDDYYSSWNINDVASHGCCCSFIGEKNLGTAEIKYCCLGFTDYEYGALQISAPYDLGSESQTEEYKIGSISPPMFLLPEDILDLTRHTHNETVWERRTISGDGSFKKQPSYIVYFVDNFEDRLTNQEAMKQWESCKKAAQDFAIEVDGIKKTLPIMVIEREKIAKSQLENIEEKTNEFKRSLNPKLIKEIVSDYESNYAGNREYHQNISKKYFPKHNNISESYLGKLIQIIEEKYESNPVLASECLSEIEQAIMDEHEKYNHSKTKMITAEPSFDISEALLRVQNIKRKYKNNLNSTLLMLEECFENQKQFKKDDMPKLEKRILDFQLSSADAIKILTKSGLSSSLSMFEQEIDEERINSKLKVYGPRHVKNVLLYSALIGQELIKDKHDLELVMQASKYLSVGKNMDGYEDHAELSSSIAVEKLKNRYPQEDLAIIKTIIEFQKAPRDYPDLDRWFKIISEDNGIFEDQITRVRKMAEIVRDADALDRTRFIDKKRLNPDFLYYYESKKLISLAAALQETYALEDLKEYKCDDKIKILLKKFTPQEVLRTIRKSTRGNGKIEDVQLFINTWIDSIKDELNESTGIIEESTNEDKNGKKVSDDSIIKLALQVDNNIKQFEKSDMPKLDQETLDSQLTADEIISLLDEKDLATTFVMLENEIKDEKINIHLKTHGPRHIKDVLLYSILIGQSVLENKYDLELIAQAAKYHDVSRITEKDEDHAKPSAEIAERKLHNKYSQEDIAIIKTIIEFHEIPRNDYNTDALFINIAKNNGVPENQLTRVRKMAEVLKDADALDRTRFINRARLEPSYLFFDTSKKLIKFSASLQEAYALQDLKEYGCDEPINLLLQSYTPQEVIRTIRHKAKGIDPKTFITNWITQNGGNTNNEGGNKYGAASSKGK